MIRIVLDPRERRQAWDHSDDVRIKRGGPFMHLKAYAIDGEVLRTGAADGCEPCSGRQTLSDRFRGSARAISRLARNSKTPDA